MTALARARFQLCWNWASGYWKLDPVPFSDEFGLRRRIRGLESMGKIPGRRDTKTWAPTLMLALFIDSESPWAIVHSGSDGSQVYTSVLIVSWW